MPCFCRLFSGPADDAAGEPAPSITYAIPESYTDEDLDDLHRQVLRAFRAYAGPEADRLWRGRLDTLGKIARPGELAALEAPAAVHGRLIAGIERRATAVL